MLFIACVYVYYKNIYCNNISRDNINFLNLFNMYLKFLYILI